MSVVADPLTIVVGGARGATLIVSPAVLGVEYAPQPMELNALTFATTSVHWIRDQGAALRTV